MILTPWIPEVFAVFHKQSSLLSILPSSSNSSLSSFVIHWTLTLAEVSHEFGSVCLFICLSVCPKPNIWELAHQFCLIFYMKLDWLEVKWVAKPDIWKSCQVRRAKKVPKIGRNEVCGVWAKIYLIFMYFFTWLWKY